MAPIDLTDQRLQAYRRDGVDRIVVGPAGRTLADQQREMSDFAERFGLQAPAVDPGA
jgi:hypothetical protein